VLVHHIAILKLKKGREFSAEDTEISISFSINKIHSVMSSGTSSPTIAQRKSSFFKRVSSGKPKDESSASDLSPSPTIGSPRKSLFSPKNKHIGELSKKPVSTELHKPSTNDLFKIPVPIYEDKVSSREASPSPAPVEIPAGLPLTRVKSSSVTNDRPASRTRSLFQRNSHEYGEQIKKINVNVASAMNMPMNIQAAPISAFTFALQANNLSSDKELEQEDQTISYSDKEHTLGDLKIKAKICEYTPSSEAGTGSDELKFRSSVISDGYDVNDKEDDDLTLDSSHEPDLKNVGQAQDDSPRGDAGQDRKKRSSSIFKRAFSKSANPAANRSSVSKSIFKIDVTVIQQSLNAEIPSNWSVLRSERDFARLHKKLKNNLMGVAVVPEYPQNNFFTANSHRRHTKFQVYLDSLCEIPEILNSNMMCSFLIGSFQDITQKMILPTKHTANDAQKKVESLEDCIKEKDEELRELREALIKAREPQIKSENEAALASERAELSSQKEELQKKNEELRALVDTLIADNKSLNDQNAKLLDAVEQINALVTNLLIRYLIY
jgi:hypothetical protein